MAYMAGWPLTTPWLALSLVLYVFAGICWLPVVWLQIRMAAIAQQSSDQNQPLPRLYQHYQLRWESLGYPAFIAMAGTYYLMVNKPALWA